VDSNPPRSFPIEHRSRCRCKAQSQSIQWSRTAFLLSRMTFFTYIGSSVAFPRSQLPAAKICSILQGTRNLFGGIVYSPPPGLSATNMILGSYSLCPLDSNRSVPDQRGIASQGHPSYCDGPFETCSSITLGRRRGTREVRTRGLALSWN
jgi:hypothetical protein